MVLASPMRCHLVLLGKDTDEKLDVFALKKKTKLETRYINKCDLAHQLTEFSQSSHGPATLAAAMVICVLWCYGSLLSMCAILSPVVLSC